MTVIELIEKLRAYPADFPVMVDGYEGGITEIFSITLVSVNRNSNTEGCYGEHEKDVYPKEPHDLAVLLDRNDDTTSYR